MPADASNVIFCLSLLAITNKTPDLRMWFEHVLFCRRWGYWETSGSSTVSVLFWDGGQSTAGAYGEYVSDRAGQSQ